MPAITEAEKQQRQRSVASSIGTMAASGIETDNVTRAVLNRYALGHISLEEMGKTLHQLSLSYYSDRPPRSAAISTDNYIIDSRQTERHEINGCVRWRTIPTEPDLLA